MSGSVPQRPGPRGFGRGAALTLVFVGMLGTAAATDSLPGSGASRDARPRPAAVTLDGGAVARAAARAIARGDSGADAAQQVVSRSGDRWSAVYDKDEYEEFEQALDGRYTGVGVGARRTADGLLEITRVQRGGPAQRAGVRPGDVLRSVNGRSVTGLPVTEVMGMLRGDSPGARRAAAPGSAVALGTERDGHRASRSVRRARLDAPSVSVSDLPGGARRVAVESFTRGTGDDVRRAVRDAPRGAGIVLDLRGNGGGLVSEAVKAASAFLDGGLVATYSMNGRQHTLYAEHGGDTERPVVVLVDGGTMSAAELLTGALQDRGRAVVVGSRTFGKGSIQMPTTLPDGSVAELTVGHYRTPAGRAVDGRGITPDLVAAQDTEARAETVLTGLGAGA
ncbi:S41 family peptidase [Streptomyces montanisoli]|uniref:PDZ domain-containing protein n=1 Tax=Streptomyces montanisoli TaxID=2798581 RepID=A0A940MCW2_9ACTN|nr:S41 family peptidase [Streptomyces montanisoli]MBP0458578.1 PDZ domain-containing protein [Streptomyces montanisoli]